MIPRVSDRQLEEFEDAIAIACALKSATPIVGHQAERLTALLVPDVPRYFRRGGEFVISPHALLMPFLATSRASNRGRQRCFVLACSALPQTVIATVGADRELRDPPGGRDFFKEFGV